MLKFIFFIIETIKKIYIFLKEIYIYIYIHISFINFKPLYFIHDEKISNQRFR